MFKELDELRNLLTVLQNKVNELESKYKEAITNKDQIISDLLLQLKSKPEAKPISEQKSDRVPDLEKDNDLTLDFDLDEDLALDKDIDLEKNKDLAVDFDLDEYLALDKDVLLGKDKDFELFRDNGKDNRNIDLNSSYDWMRDRPGMAVDSIRKAFSLNDRILLTNELFSGDGEAFDSMLGLIDNSENFTQVVDHCIKNYPQWDLNSQSVYRFFMEVRRRLI